MRGQLKMSGGISGHFVIVRSQQKLGHFLGWSVGWRGRVTCVRDIPHGVFEGPDDGVQHQLELLGRDREEGRETVGVYCLGGRGGGREYWG